MPININTEQIVTLTEAAKILPTRGGKRIAISTLWRWCRKGLNGVQLEYVRMGRNIATSREALNRFFVALADADGTPGPALAKPLPLSMRRPLGGLSPRARQAAIERAERFLDRAGV